MIEYEQLSQVWDANEFFVQYAAVPYQRENAMNRIILFQMVTVGFVVALLINGSTTANGQENDKAVGMKPALASETEEPSFQQLQAPAEVTSEGNPLKLWGPETVLAIAVIVFCLIVLWVQYQLVMRDTVDWTPNTIIRFFGLTLIINGGVLLVVAGFSSQQIAGVLGLLGSIAGYLLGASSKGSTDGDSRTVANSRTQSSQSGSDDN